MRCIFWLRYLRNGGMTTIDINCSSNQARAWSECFLSVDIMYTRKVYVAVRYYGYFQNGWCDNTWKGAWKEWASYQIRKIAGCACAGNAGNVFPRRRFQMKPLFSDPGMHHGTCVTHVPWCMPGSLTCGDGENVPGIPGACAPAILRIWQEAHGLFTIQTTMNYISLDH